MQLTETQKCILRYTKEPTSQFDWKSIVSGGLGKIYSYHMHLSNVHRIVFEVFQGFYNTPEFRIPRDALYEVLTSVSEDFDYKYKGVDTPKSVPDVLQSQLTKMLTYIMLTRIDWLEGEY